MDRFTRTTRQSWFSRMAGSFMGVLFGLAMFFGSFVLLFFMEGRVNLSKVAKKATVFQAADNVPSGAEGNLVAISGELSTEEDLGDEYLNTGNYLFIEREVEMYAWDEESKSRKRKKIGGSETTRTTYTYRKKWMSDPEDSDDFEEPRGHYNPEMRIQSKFIQPSTAKIGEYEIDAQQINMPRATDLSLSESMVNGSSDLRLENNDYLFVGEGTYRQPEVGDLRIHYKVVQNPLPNATVLGELNGDRLEAYNGPRGSKLYHAFKGSYKDAVSTLRKEHNQTTWVFRFIGFFLMWIGMVLIFGPISTFFDLIPLAGNLTRNVIAGISFLVALSLTSVTIIVSILVHNFWLMIGIVAAVAIGMVIFAKMRKQAKDRA
jgi:hypothetical protein